MGGMTVALAQENAEKRGLPQTLLSTICSLECISLGKIPFYWSLLSFIFKCYFPNS